MKRKTKITKEERTIVDKYIETFEIDNNVKQIKTICYNFIRLSAAYDFLRMVKTGTAQNWMRLTYDEYKKGLFTEKDMIQIINRVYEFHCNDLPEEKSEYVIDQIDFKKRFCHLM